jgi:hypothetical protein
MDDLVQLSFCKSNMEKHFCIMLNAMKSNDGILNRIPPDLPIEQKEIKKNTIFLLSLYLALPQPHFG